MKKSELRNTIRQIIKEETKKAPSWLKKKGDTLNLKSDDSMDLKAGTYKIKDVVFKDGDWVYVFDKGGEYNADYIHGKGGYWKNSLIKENLIKKKPLNEGLDTEEGRKMYKVFNILGYDNFHEFIGDNPGIIDEMLQWIQSVPEFREALSELTREALDDLGLYDIESETEDEDEEYYEDEEF